jgi:glycosyltransferase involved in cell wall biosynthesis
LKEHPRIALIKLGSFSLINDRVQHILAEQFPRHAVDVMEISRIVQTRTLSNAAWALSRYGLDLLSRRKDPWNCLLRTPATFDAIKSAMARVIDPRRHEFTFQTQSLFDSSVSDVPHFVYTDHVHLANLRYPGVGARDLYHPQWICRERTIYANAVATLTTSEFAARSLIEDYAHPKERVQCVGSGVNVPVTVGRAPAAPNAQEVLFVGLQWDRKGGPDLIEAFRKALAECPMARLTIVGCRPRVSVPRVTVVGRVSADEVARYYARASVFCMPSRVEPSAVALVEAAAHGLPVVSTTVGGTPERVIDSKTGYLVPPGDIDALSRRLVELLRNQDRARQLGAAGAAMVATHFSWERVGDRIGAAIRTHLPGLV